MILGNISLEEAENYLNQLEQLAEEIEYARREFRNRLERYQRETTPQTRVDLQSSIAHFQKHIRPVAIQQRVSERRFIGPSDTLEIGIDQEWQAYEFRQLFHGLDYLHKVYALRTKLSRESPDLRLSREMTRSQVFRYALLYYYFAPHEELQVRSIQFSSPGSISVEGLGDAIRELKELFHYIVTFQFVKGFVDLYDHFKYDRPIERTEKRMKLKELIRREQSQERRFALEELGEYKEFLEKMNGIADLAIELDKKGLARGVLVEEAAIKSIAMLHRLSFDEQKVKFGRQVRDG
jgi:hypothetical protein